MEVEIGKVYYHHKAGENPKEGDLYTYGVLKLGDWETLSKLGFEYTEDDDPITRGMLVGYEQLYSIDDKPIGYKWARPLEGVKGFTTPEGDKPRFRLLEE